MTRGLVALALALMFLASPVSQPLADFTYPQLPEQGSDPSDWIMSGWRAKATAKGDLNKDKREDVALILEREKPVDHVRGCGANRDGSAAPPRILVLLLAQADGGYRLSAADTDIVLRSDEGGIFGDPLEMLLIERGSVLLRHYGGSAWRWVQTYRFRNQDGGWFLIGYTDGTNHNISRLSTMYDYNPLTGKMEITATDEKGRPGCYACLPGEKCPATKRCDKGEKRAKREVTWVKTKRRPLISLEDAYCRQLADRILPIAPRW
ncbi:MAG: hypothetical protein MPJ78_15420 [Hyphomicrobiaceae bacterium]|nr:hypothetical protein [Hyphomicrobiaceae bacterium]